MILKNKVAIVTGASSGIGRATAKLFAQEGAKLVLAARRGNLLDELVAEIKLDGGQAVCLAGDVQQESHAKALVDCAIDTYGALDIAFNNAGIIGAGKPVTELSLAEWQETQAINLTSGFLGAKYQAPVMVKQGNGSLIFTSSFLGYTVGFPGYADYAASKAGLLGLTKVLAVEVGPMGVRVNALLPGGTDTPMNFANAPDAGPEVLEFLNNFHALKRMARPEEIANSALYLASDASSFVTGTSMLADGGASITKT